MLREVKPEILDDLDPLDSRAIHSRRDLQRVNALMGHSRILARALRSHINGARVVELGAGDGTCLLRVAHRLGTERPLSVILLDRRPSVTEDTRAGFARIGWNIDVIEADVFEWLRRAADRCDVTIANLFLHHFQPAALSELLARTCEKTRTFVACEPRRSAASMIGAQMLRVLGCNDVTLHDAPISVRAGFRARELSALWPGGKNWRLREGRSGAFTHTFLARHAP
jgi:hypothetical protein